MAVQSQLRVSIPAAWCRCCRRTPLLTAAWPGLAWPKPGHHRRRRHAVHQNGMGCHSIGKAWWKHLGNFTGLVKIFSHELKYLSPNIIKSTYLLLLVSISRLYTYVRFLSSIEMGITKMVKQSYSMHFLKYVTYYFWFWCYKALEKLK